LQFEGSEKKAEIIVDSSQLSLISDLPETFWQELVACSNAKILSSIENKDCKAYLLSESSLFVWQDRCLIITCGITTLANAVEYFLNHIEPSTVLHVGYQRKNEYFAHAQLSSFGDDIKQLTKSIDGIAYRFGDLDSHHHYIFHQNNNYRFSEEYQSFEVVAYQISPTILKELTKSNIVNAEIRNFLNVDFLLPDFQIDDFVFTPSGYSLNAIKGKDYLTIHVTPHADCSYVSICASFDITLIARVLLSLLSPKSIDVVSTNHPEFIQQVKENINEEFISKALVQKKLSNSNQISFAHIIVPQINYNEPVEINISDENHSL